MSVQVKYDAVLNCFVSCWPRAGYRPTPEIVHNGDVFYDYAREEQSGPMSEYIQAKEDKE